PSWRRVRSLCTQLEAERGYYKDSDGEASLHRGRAPILPRQCSTRLVLYEAVVLSVRPLDWKWAYRRGAPKRRPRTLPNRTSKDPRIRWWGLPGHAFFKQPVADETARVFELP